MIVFSFLFCNYAYSLMLNSEKTLEIMPVKRIDLIKNMSNLFLDTQPPIFPLTKIMDNFDGTSDAVYTWWDGDGTEVYQRSLDSEFMRSGIYSMKVDYIKRSEKYKFSFLPSNLNRME